MSDVALLFSEDDATEAEIDKVIFFERFEKLLTFNIVTPCTIQNEAFAKSLDIVVYRCGRGLSSVRGKTVGYLFRGNDISYVVKKETGMDVLSIIKLDVVDGKVVIEKTLED